MWNNTTNSCKTTVVTFISTQVINNTPRFSWQTIQNEIQHATGQLSNVTSCWAWSSAVCLQRTYQLAVAIIFNWQDLDPTPLSFPNRTLLHIMYLVWLIFQRVPHHHRGFPLCRGSHFSSGCWGQRGFIFSGGHLQWVPIFEKVATRRGLPFSRGVPFAEGSHFPQGSH